MFRTTLLILITILLSVSSSWSYSWSGPATTLTLNSSGSWQWNIGSGEQFCKVNSIDDVVFTTNNNISNGAVTKYGTVGVWATTITPLLKSIGFNTVAADEYFTSYGGNWPTGGIPFTPQETLSLYSHSGTFSLVPVKGVGDALGATAICNPALGLQIDPYDPNIQTDFSDMVAGSCPANCQGDEVYSTINIAHTGTHIAMIIAEEADSMAGLDSSETHTDGAYDVAVANPTVSTWSTTDKTFYAKQLGFRDTLLNNYFCTANATPLACCTANHSGTCTAGTGTTLSSTQLSNALTALNTAWSLTGSTVCTSTTSTICNSGYTTWNTSDSGGLTGIANGTYASWGSGTGVLDENGKRIISPSNASGTCNVGGNFNWSDRSTIMSDISGVVGGTGAGTDRTGTNSLAFHYADKYGSILQTAYSVNGPNPLPPIFDPIYCGPPNVYQAIAPHLSALGGGFWMSCGGTGLTGPTDMHYFQAAMNAAYNAANKRVPFILTTFATGQTSLGSDSPYGPQAVGNNQGAADQHLRAVNDFIAFWQAGLSLKDPIGKYDDVSNEEYMFYDKPNEGVGTNFGLISSAKDNLYDGAASTNFNSWTTGCQTNHTYTGPVGCKDANNNYEGAQLAYGATCVSGNPAPTWSKIFGNVTNDGTCKWRNEGGNAPVAETSTQVGASGHATNYGNNTAGGVIQPLQDFFNATGSYNTWIDTNGITRSGVCDPVIITPTGIKYRANGGAW